jgi:predicted nucleic acid-binding protein
VIFVDTSFWVALRNPRDGRHAEATSLLASVGPVQLVTTNHVRGETWTFLRARMGHHSAVACLDTIRRSPRIEVVAVPTEMEETALTWLRRHDERAYSFVDATSFALMRSLKIKNALAFDGDFTAAGFRELRA